MKATIVNKTKTCLAVTLYPIVVCNYYLRKRKIVKDRWFICDKWILRLGYVVTSKYKLKSLLEV